MTHHHDDKKESLRRRRELIQQVAELFEDYAAQMRRTAQAFGKLPRGHGPHYGQFLVSEEPTQALSEAHLNLLEEQLFKLQTRLGLEQLAKCQTSLLELVIAGAKFKDSDGNEVESIFADWEEACTAFRNVLLGTYKALRLHPNPL